MLFRNFTPFPPLQFESRDEQRCDFGVVVLRGTFEIRNHQPLFLVQEQEPLIMADIYQGEPGKSGLWKEGNLAPYKPKTDIHINAIAHAPEGKPLPQWNVAVKASVGRQSVADIQFHEVCEARVGKGLETFHREWRERIPALRAMM